MPTASYLAAAIVLEVGSGERAGCGLHLWLRRAALELVGVEADQAKLHEPPAEGMGGDAIVPA
jgi:hypothetical protein